MSDILNSLRSALGDDVDYTDRYRSGNYLRSLPLSAPLKAHLGDNLVGKQYWHNIKEERYLLDPSIPADFYPSSNVMVPGGYKVLHNLDKVPNLIEMPDVHFASIPFPNHVLEDLERIRYRWFAVEIWVYNQRLPGKQEGFDINVLTTDYTDPSHPNMRALGMDWDVDHDGPHQNFSPYSLGMRINECIQTLEEERVGLFFWQFNNLPSSYIVEVKPGNETTHPDAVYQVAQFLTSYGYNVVYTIYFAHHGTIERLGIKI